MSIKRKMLSVGTLKSKAKEYGAEIEGGIIGKWASYNLDAPAGKLWSASSTHCLHVEWRTDEPNYRNDAIADALERMAYGLCDCDDDDCDVCS